MVTAWRLVACTAAGLSVGAAAPSSGSFSITAPVPAITMQRRAPVQTLPQPDRFTAAPTPDHDASAPTTRASNEATVAPGFFTRRDQYRGEGLSPSFSAQAEQDRRAKPGAGINLRMPIQ